MSVLGRSSRSPRSASSWRTQLRRASGCTFSCSPNRRNVGRGDDSRYSRTARSRSSSGYFFGAANSAFLPGSQDRTSLGRLRRSGGTSQQLADAAGLITWDVSVDSTIARAHQHAAGARHDPGSQVEPPGDEPADHALGRSRGGWTTKIHLACEQGRKPMSLLITGGQRGDSPQFVPVLEGIRVPKAGRGRPRTRPDQVFADKAYSSRANRGYLRRRRIRATIPIKLDQRAN